MTRQTFQHQIDRLWGKTPKRDRTNNTYTDPRKTHHIAKAKSGRVVAWDGEGVNSADGKQRYVLLMNNKGVIISDVNGLSTLTCLNTIMQSATDSSTLHFVYGGTYDFCMILRDLPERDLRALHAGKVVTYHNYKIEYRARKQLTIRHFHRVWNEEKQDRDRVVDKSVTLWDVLGFFQCTFVQALEEYFCPKRGGNSVTIAEWKQKIARIKEGKDRRREFTAEELENFIIPYCQLEVECLCDLMKLLMQYFLDAGMVLSRWDGSGAVSTCLLRKHDVKPHINLEMIDIPDEVVDISEYAYFGGRIETILFGNYENTVHHYDINSAYPSVMVDLPSLLYGEWNHETTYAHLWRSHPPVTCYLISWHMEDNTFPICPFPWRTSLGSVLFPPDGKAWVWKPELDAALIAKQEGKLDIEIYIHEAWSFTPTRDVKPFAFIHDLYEIRKKHVEEGNGVEKAYKLGYNGMYGKTAQSLGYDEKEDRKPPYHNLVIAGMITSATRAKLFTAAMQSPYDIIMLATDGLFSKVPLDLPCPKEKILGLWEYKTHDYMTIIMSGVYWLGNKEGDDNVWSRGFDKEVDKEKKVKFVDARPIILDKWRKGEIDIEFPSTRFITIGSAVGLNDFSQFCTWRTIQRKLTLDMSTVVKREKVKISVDLTRELQRSYPRNKWAIRLMVQDGYWPISDHYLSNKAQFQWNKALIDGLTARQYNEEVGASKE